MVLTRPRLGVYVYRLLVAASIVLLLKAVLEHPFSPNDTPTWFAWTTGTVMTGAVVWCLPQARGAVTSLLPGRALIGAATVLSVVLVVWARPEPQLVPDSWLPVVCAPILASAAFASRRPLTCGLLATAWVATATALMSEPGNLAHRIGDPSTVLALGFGLTLVFVFMERMADAVTLATQHAFHVSDADIRATRHAMESQRWNSLIHDKILAALRLGARGESELARDLAADAVAVLSGLTTTSSELEADWLRRGSQLGITVEIDAVGLDQIVDPDVRDAVADAVHEALANVASHAHASQAVVRGHVDHAGGEITITDAGRGFEPELVGHDRRGILSTTARMRAVGGAVQVRSRPGVGTTVTLTWATGDVSSPMARDSEDSLYIAALKAVVALGILSLAVHVTCGVLTLSDTRSPAVALVGAVLGFCLGIASMLAARRPHVSWLIASGICVGSFLLTLNILPVSGTTWAFWFIGAAAGPASVNAFMGRKVLAFATIAGLSMAVVLGQFIGLGEVSVIQTSTGIINPLGATLVALMVRSALDRSAEMVREQEAVAASARAATIRQEEARAEHERRSRVVTDRALPLLRKIARGQVLNVAERADALRLESLLRLTLTAPTLMTPAVADVVAEAGARDVVIELAESEAPSEVEAGLVEALLLAALPTLRGPSKLTALWRPLPDGRVMTLAVVGESTTWESLPANGFDVDLDADEDATILTLRRR